MLSSPPPQKPKCLEKHSVHNNKLPTRFFPHSRDSVLVCLFFFFYLFHKMETDQSVIHLRHSDHLGSIAN